MPEYSVRSWTSVSLWPLCVYPESACPRLYISVAFAIKPTWISLIAVRHVMLPLDCCTLHVLFVTLPSWHSGVIVLSFCEQDNSRTWKRMLTKHGRHGHWVTLYFWCWSRSACGFGITFSFTSLLWNRTFLEICYHFSYSH